MQETIKTLNTSSEGLTHFNELRKLCPSFEKGCPFTNIEEVKAALAKNEEFPSCPASQNGCPFSKNEEEMAELLKQVPEGHPLSNVKELPSGPVLIQQLSQYLDIPQATSTLQNGTEEAKESASELPSLAEAMRMETRAIHQAAVTSVFTRRFAKGEITPDEYGCYLIALYFVYKNMESLLEKHKDNPIVKAVHFPHELNRVKSIKKDLAYFYGSDRVSEVTNPRMMTPVVREYVQAMKDACAKDPALMISHSYARYFGDLTGGRILADRLKRHVLGLKDDEGSWDTSEGVSFYDFTNLGNHADFKNTYRECLNAVPIDAKTRELVIKEAVHTIELNVALFDEIEKLSEEGNLIPTILNKSNEKAETVEETSAGKYRWVGVVSVAVATAAIGAAMYQRFYKQNQ